MIKETGVEEFLQIINKLPTDPLYKKKWLRWLAEYNTAGYYKRQIDKKRSARFAYNHLANPEMLLWLARTAGVEENLVNQAKSNCLKFSNPNKQSAIIRKLVPWEVLELALVKEKNRQPTHWLQYWKPFQIKDAITEPWILDYSVGDQLAKVFPGDTVWIVSVDPPGRLITLGPIYVEQIINRRRAEREIGEDTWSGDWYIVNFGEDVYPAKYVDLSSIASRLQFISDDSPKLELKHGKVSGTQFQKIRRLEPKSSDLIRREWQKAKLQTEVDIDKRNTELDHLVSLDERRSTTIRREQKILRQILFGSTDTCKCGICGQEYPTPLLVVAHIKPRAKCSDAERRDIANNLMPLCLFGCDALFEQGFISIDSGYVISGPNRATTKNLAARVNLITGLQCKYWSKESKKYFDWRANHPFQIGIDE